MATTKTMGRFDSASLTRFAFHLPFHRLDAVAPARAHANLLQ
jgi:hypothetical protein